MPRNDDDIKIFHPKKKETASADLAALAATMDQQRQNGNAQKAEDLGTALASLSPETLLPDTAKTLANNELLQLRALIVFAAQLALHKYLPQPMLATQAINAMHARLEETSPGLAANIADGSSFSFYYLAVRTKADETRDIGENFAMLCERDNDERFIALGSRAYLLTDAAVWAQVDARAFEA